MLQDEFVLRIRHIENSEMARWPTSDNPAAVQESVTPLSCDAPMLSRDREPGKPWPDKLTCAAPLTRPPTSRAKVARPVPRAKVARPVPPVRWNKH
jgi:hypothetical protein